MGSSGNPEGGGASPAWQLPESLEGLARSGDARLVAEIMNDFRSDGVVRLARLRVGQQRGDAEAVRLEAHSLKGSAAQMGAGRLAAACQALEVEARGGSLGHGAARIEEIQALFDDVSRAIARHPLYGNG